MGTSISTALDPSRVEAALGYKIEGSLEGVALGLLQQRIDIVAECNTAKQATVPDYLEFTSASEVAAEYGDDSPAYLAARLIRPPLSNNKLGSIKTRILTVKEDGTGTAGTSTTTVTGTATANATYKLKVNGRTSVDGNSYIFNVAKDDTASEVAQKMSDAANAVYGCPGTGSVSTADFILTSGWKGQTAVLNVEVETGDVDTGLTFSTVQVVGTGQLTTGLTDALAQIGDEWVTMIVNCLASTSDNLDAYETFVGNPNLSTGKYDPIEFRPCFVFSGDVSLTTVANAETLTDGRKDEVANIIVPNPNSGNFDFESAADMVYEYAYSAQRIPSKDPMGTILTQVEPGSYGDFDDTYLRDSIVKAGTSTVKKNGDNPEVVSLVTTYHPDSEPVTAKLFRYARDLMVDWNIYFQYKQLHFQYVEGKTIGAGENTITLERWRGILVKQLLPSLIANGLIVDEDYFKENLQVEIDPQNANRINTVMGDKRSGVARQNSTTVKTTLNFG